jgi:predicted nucleic acid-binding protein
VRVCLDTNVLVAAFATRGLCADVLRTVLAEHDLVVGEVILAELRRVLTPSSRCQPIASTLS